MSIRHGSAMYSDKNEKPVQFDFTAWSQPAGFSPILSDTCPLAGFMMVKHCHSACNLVENITESSIITLNTPASMAENDNDSNLEVFHKFFFNVSTCHACDATFFEYSAKIIGPNVRETHDISRGSDTFGHTLIFQLIIVLLVMSLVVFCFLHFKRSSKARSTIDPEFQDLVIKHQTFATNDTDPHNTNYEKEKAQTLTATTNSVPDIKQIQEKMPDIINSRD